MTDNKEISKYLVLLGKILCIFVLLYISVFPFVRAACYTLPNIDDFSNAINMRNLVPEQGYLRTAFQDMFNIYMTWQGTYTGNLIVYGLSVLYNWSYVGIRIFAVINILFFVFSVAYCFNKILKYIFGIKDWFGAWLFSSLFCLAYFGVRIHHDLFYFHTASCMYTVPLAFALISIGLGCEAILGDYTKKYKFVLGIFWGILGCGGSLQIPAFICFFYLVLVGYAWVYKKEKLKNALIMFGFVLGGVLANVAAPGNFARQSHMNSGLDIISIIQAIKYALALVNFELRYMFEETYSLFILLFLFFLFYKILPIGKTSVYINPIIVLVGVIAGVAITTFPLTLAHGNTYMENRNNSCLDFFLLFGLFIFVLSCINYLRGVKKISLEKKDFLIAYVSLIGMIFSFQGSHPFKEIPFYKCSLQLEKEMIQLTAKEYINAFEYIKNSEESVVVIPYFSNYQGILMVLEFSENEEYWVNADVASFFDKEAVYVSETAEKIFME